MLALQMYISVNAELFLRNDTPHINSINKNDSYLQMSFNMITIVMFQETCIIFSLAARSIPELIYLYNAIRFFKVAISG